ncbi:hypothetical protein [Myxococcus landrumensis]|uniref:Uncharacterized protein n=1 Tax=Myxococcus landrumensis TaxID=2813577 RepID=A0ABX7N8Y9_9BACT|nr:hypothetical protein [Myxococcus landrumus]QSQ14014.1 hypothetical protein JY572_37825 [Myxococcus landrumus]
MATPEEIKSIKDYWTEYFERNPDIKPAQVRRILGGFIEIHREQGSDDVADPLQKLLNELTTD